ncbi:uncharacterized protein BJ171DRAFT_580131 [Polychytrium aggregatum]|uniref:uncharacterized protein n=1 Tax=Polychytrium aggregatum TaxID=110093 RepID=UPI0022FEEEFB|nr:uncharacterized protein BJ171DRAFT_580131 [Polychytrium aggregatum]KAI9206057.1 hypothetical protein BJ171DRAFT_580131 [Polychytrium aggregatum]
MSAPASAPLQFDTFSSAVEATFWHALAARKVDVLRLDDSPLPIQGFYDGHSNNTALSNALSSGARSAGSLPARLCLSSSAFEPGQNIPPFSCVAPGTLKNTNTVEDFKALDKNALLKDTAEQIWQDICSGAALDDPSLLSRFLLVTFADLKKYKYFYWFAFPALMPTLPLRLQEGTAVAPLAEYYSEQQIAALYQSFSTLRERQPSKASFFQVVEGEVPVAQALSDAPEQVPEEMTVGFVDPSCLPGNPGWPLRNYAIFLKKTWPTLQRIKVVCYREVLGRSDISSSLVVLLDVSSLELGDDCPKFGGWEKNTSGKLGARVVDLAPLMDPHRLADTAVDLNLKLMRWRIMPSLQLERIGATKCLLFGAGTLGCYVARLLMAWGIRNITLLDNGKVSFSNPVRQPLFEFNDCLDGGKPKAAAAAEQLRKIFPGVNAEGHSVTIPMPGHEVPAHLVGQVKEDVAKIEELVKSHDVLFLLTDSREARWLPTLLGAYHEKIVINAALGFDTFLVMRHGMRAAAAGTDSRLGCYFCNDVVAPTDSLSDRTLDQQCTVTRPGLSALASSQAVELMVSVINHPLAGHAPADSQTSPADATPTPFGLVPHQIRGFLTHFNNLLITGSAYDKCTACSPTVLAEYQNDGYQFLLKAFNTPKYLEQITGLADLHQQTEAADVDWIEDDDEDQLI